MHIHIPYFDYMKFSRRGLYFSAALIVISFFLMLFKGFNLGLEFTGGATIELQFAQTADIPKIRETVDKFHPNASVVQYGSSRDVQITFGELKDKDTDALLSEMVAGLKKAYPDAVLMGQSKIGGQYREELIEKGITALVLSCLGMVLYLGLRFEWKFALGAVLADIHDIVVVAAVFSLMGWTFDLNVLAALLAILGYSVNDTVVLYDRIRENMRLMSNKKTVQEIINHSIQQTMTRTVITSLTTMLAVIALLIWGGTTLFGFSIAMFLGILIGTYSSIFVATSLVKEMDLKHEDLLPKKRK